MTIQTETVLTLIHSDNVSLKLLADVITEEAMTRRQYRVIARSADDVQFYQTKHDTLRAALADVAHFNLCEFASSVYVTDDNDESAFTEYLDSHYDTMN